MFRTVDGQLAAGVEVDDLRHAVKGGAVLTQDVLVLLGPRQLHVHEALAAPKGRGGGRAEGWGEMSASGIQLFEHEHAGVLFPVRVRI